jgi:hypothetical protein
MRKLERGYMLSEMAMSLAILALLSGAIGVLGFRVFKGTEGNTDHMITTRDLDDAGYQIYRDATMAQTVYTANLSDPNFIIFGWAVWDSQNQPHYHSVNYYFEARTNNIGRLKRFHWSSDGVSENTTVAYHIYFNASNPANSSNASYSNRELLINLNSVYESSNETRQFMIICRPNYY